MMISASDRQLTQFRDVSLILETESYTNPRMDAGKLHAEGRHAWPVRRLRLDLPATHRPTAAECYGCVDWFPY